MTRIRLQIRAMKRAGAFIRARKGGLTGREARVYSDALYPPNAADLAYEAKLHAEQQVKMARRAAGIPEPSKWWRFGNPLWDMLHVNQIVCDPTISTWQVLRSSLVIVALIFVWWLIGHWFPRG